MKNKALLPILAGFFVMGFGGIIGTVMFQIKNECAADAAVKVPESETFKIQELHLPVYHALCAKVEEQLF